VAERCKLRGSRLDVASLRAAWNGAAIFRTDRDRADFVGGIERLIGEADRARFAYVLMGNHFRLVLRRAATRLGQFMQRLLTGYSEAFNRRHQRAGLRCPALFPGGMAEVRVRLQP
jgi:hypothetical protein